MRELPSPAYPLSLGPRPAPPASPAESGMVAQWAQHQDEVRAAQRLRYTVFAGEMGAQLATPLPGYDIDLFDDYCEHLLVREAASGEVVGTYRVLTPVQARRVGSFYADTEFDLTRLRQLRPRMMELGRSCVRPDHRQGGVIMGLWSALAGFMQRNGLDLVIGSASVPLRQQGVFNPAVAASLWRRLRADHLAPITEHVLPRLPLPVERLDDSLQVDAPPLIKGYLRLGAKLLGPPAWDPDFNTADLPLLMRLHDMPARYSRHFTGSR
nr:GNAT family N-acyltransferase [Variovorax boronicumulans]